ncbi:MAG: sigma-70 family RNA polymerase sigma factor [Steroidobacteraceae bacterium]
MQSRSDDNIAAAGETDAEIWAAFAAQPLIGFERLYDRYSSLVFGLARTIMANSQDAEDLTHEVFMSLLTRRTYEPARGSLPSFLTAVTRSRAIDRLRASSRRIRLLDGRVALDETDSTSTSLPLEKVAMDESAQAVRTAMAALPPSQRRVLELAYFKGLSQAEIAAHLDTPLGTVKSWARQGLQSLRNALGEFLDR